MKNKRIVTFVLLLSLTMLFLASCNIFNSTSETDTDTDTDKDINITEPSDETAKKPINISVKPSNGRIEVFYSDDTVVPVSSEAISDYIDKTVASSRLTSLYADSDSVSSIPVLGTYLEKTMLCVCLKSKARSSEPKRCW